MVWVQALVRVIRLGFVVQESLPVPLCIYIYKWAMASLILEGVTLQWISIPSKEE